MIWIPDNGNTTSDGQPGSPGDLYLPRVSAEFKDAFIASTSSTTH